MASTSLLALITTSLIYQLTSSQTICLWGRDGYNARISGPYTQQNNYNNKSYYGKTWGSGCNTFYIYWTGSIWAVSIDLGSKSNIYAYCQSSSTLTNCQNWYIWSGSSWGLDSAVSISNGSCPVWVCDTITINNAPNNCDSFTVALGNNIWRNSGSTRWWYFDPYYYSWRCTDYAPYACDRGLWTWSEEGWDELSKGESMSITLLYPSTQTRTLNCVADPTTAPTKIPTNMPLKVPTNMPSLSPTNMPSVLPTKLRPSARPTTAHIMQTSTQINTVYSTFESTEDFRSESKNKLHPILITSIILTLIICISVIIFFSLYIKNLYRKAKGNQFDYAELTNVNPFSTGGKECETSIDETLNADYEMTATLLSGGEDESLNEMGEDDYISEDELYAKPYPASKDKATSGQQGFQIIHFYYKDFVSDHDEYDDNQELYHEKQKWEMCLMHACNGLLQKQVFTVKSMNGICKELAPDKLINPHKSLLQTGNYDANVLMMALRKMNIEVQWFDARKADELNLNDEQFLDFLEGDNLLFVGFILNNPLKAAFKMFTRRHWIAIKQINGVWYNLDSKLKQPMKYKNEEELTAYLVDGLKQNGAELMICRKQKSNEHSKQKMVEINVALEW